MIRYTLNSTDQIGIEQFETPPTVYLDHWALRLMSDNEGVCDDFLRILKARNGTLAISWLNLIEFTNVGDPGAHERAETLIEKALPNVFMMEVNPFVVIKAENALLQGGPPAPPHADRGFLELIGTLKTTSLTGFTARGLVTHMHGSSVADEFARLSDEIIAGLDHQRSEHSGSPNFQKLIRRPPAGPPIQRGTRYVFRELARTFLVDKSIPLSRNNAIDFLHATVPISYCDFVLLDGHWEDQISRVRTRFAKANMTVPLASVHSRRADGVRRFLQSLSDA